MQNKKSFNIYLKIKLLIFNSFRNYYLKSNFYNKKISKIKKNNLVYKPSPNLFDCIIKYNKQKTNIKEFDIEEIWRINNINDKNFRRLNNFYWLFSIDLKSSKQITQFIIEKWIDKNEEYNFLNWEIDILSKRIISWISNSKLTYEDSSEDYKKKLNFIIKKQINHLINEINRSKSFDNKIIGCTAIVLTGLVYKDEHYLEYGIKLLSKFIKYSLDENKFPKTRSLRQLIFYLKHLVLIRELLKESLSEIPDFLDEAIFYLGKSYSLICQNNPTSYLFNGNQESNNQNFDIYLKEQGYKFTETSSEAGDYVILKNKKNSLIIDLGSCPEKKFTNNYQFGALSFEFTHSDKKVICNSGYFQKVNHQLNDISRSSAAHSSLIIENNSISNFKRDGLGNKYIYRNFKVFEKKIFSDKNIWSIEGSHDGYLYKYGLIHKRCIKFYQNNYSLIGKDIIITKKTFKPYNFEVRFHLYPGSKVTKTVDKKVILIEVGDTGWKFICENFLTEVETGLYFGKKNSYIDNQNIVIYGKINNQIQNIDWKIEKI